uniref:Uncharacterized protein n=1 Tax=Glossina palpalis gambiensis TaxID=67801 RepID=A0A1B0B2B8_9MUSC
MEVCRLDSIFCRESKNLNNERTSAATLAYINEARVVLSRANQPSKYKEIELKTHLFVQEHTLVNEFNKFNGLPSAAATIIVTTHIFLLFSVALNSDINFNDILTGYYKYGQSPTDVLDCL